MRITCPNCAASYEVPESKLAGRKAVRCSRCGKDWSPGIPDPATAAAPGPEAVEPPPFQLDLSRVVEAEGVAQVQEPAPPVDVASAPRLRQPSGEFTAMERLSRAAEPPPPSIWLRVAWAVSVVVVALMLWSAFNWRNDIMRVWPPSTRAYAALGLTSTTK